MTKKQQQRHTIGAFIIAISLLAIFNSPLGETPNDDNNNITVDNNYTPNVRRRSLQSVSKKKKMALIRPFGVHDGDTLLKSFELWDSRWPCTHDDQTYDVDLVLSYSRNFSSGGGGKDDNNDEEKMQLLTALNVVNSLHEKFLSEANDGILHHWSECFVGLRVIESDIDISKDKYERDDHTGVPMSLDWVAGKLVISCAFCFNTAALIHLTRITLSIYKIKDPTHNSVRPSHKS